MPLPNMTKKDLVKFLKMLEEHPLPMDLADYIEEKASNPEVIKKHLETCEECRAGLENLKDMPPIAPLDVSKMQKLLSHSRPMPKPEKAPDIVEFGQVWITKKQIGLSDAKKYTFDIPLTVVITLGEQSSYDNRNEYKNIRVAPISEITSLASEKDLLLGKQEPPLFTKEMIEIWNEVPTLKSVLETYVGTLSEKSQNYLKQMLKAEHTGETLPESIPRGFPIIGEDDPRLEFQEMEQRANKVLSALPFQLIDEWGEEEVISDPYIIFSQVEDLERKNTREAFKEILHKLDPSTEQWRNSPQALLHRGFALYRLDKDEEALSLLQQAYKKAKETNEMQTACWAATRLAQYYCFNDKYTKGLTYIQKAKELYKKSYNTRLRAIMTRTEGELLIRKRKIDNGLNLLKKAIAYFKIAEWTSQEIDAAYFYASELAKTGLDAFEKEIKYLKKLIKDFKKRYNFKSGTLDTTTEFAALFAFTGNINDARQFLDDFVCQSGISKKDHAKALLDVVGDTLPVIKDQAVPLLEQILQLVDTGEVANLPRITLSKYYIDGGHIDEGIKLCKAVLDDPNASDLSLFAKGNLAFALYKKGDIEGAKNILPKYEEAEKINNKELLWLIKEIKGNILAQEEHYKESAASYREALKIGGNAIMEDQKVITICLYADILLYLNKFKKATKVFDKLQNIQLRSVPPHANAFYLLTQGSFFEYKNKFKDAQKEIEKAKNIYESLGDKRGVAFSAYRLIFIAIKRKDPKLFFKCINEVRNASIDIPQLRKFIQELTALINEKPKDIELSRLDKHQAERIAANLRNNFNIRNKIGNLRIGADKMHYMPLSLF